VVRLPEGSGMQRLLGMLLDNKGVSAELERRGPAAWRRSLHRRRCSLDRLIRRSQPRRFGGRIATTARSKQEVIIDAPLEAVWSFSMDLTKIPEFHPRVFKVDFIDGKEASQKVDSGNLCSELMETEANSLRVAASTKTTKSGLFARFASFTTQFLYLRNRFFQIGHTEKNEDAWSGIISVQTSFDRRSLEPALRACSHEMKIPAEQLPQESPSLTGVSRPKLNIRNF
jgi:hypothetical protein